MWLHTPPAQRLRLSMGGTRALLTIRDVGGKTLYINNAESAQYYMALWKPVEAPMCSFSDEISQHASTIEAGLRVQHLLSGGTQVSPLKMAIQALRQLNRAVNVSKHGQEVSDSTSTAPHAPPLAEHRRANEAGVLPVPGCPVSECPLPAPGHFELFDMDIAACMGGDRHGEAVPRTMLAADPSKEFVFGDSHDEACTTTELPNLEGIGVCTRTTGTITSRPRRRSVGTSTSLDNMLALEATSDGHVPCSGTVAPAPAESAQRAQLDQGVPVQHTAASLPVDQAVVRVAEMDMGRPGRFNDEDAVAGAHPALPPSSGGHISMDAKASADAGAVKVRVIEAGEYPPAFRARRRLLGDRGRFVHHIQDVTGATVWCRGSPLAFHLTSGSDESLDKAEHLVQDLVNTVAQQFAQWNKGRRALCEAWGPQVRRSAFPG